MRIARERILDAPENYAHVPVLHEKRWYMSVKTPSIVGDQLPHLLLLIAGKHSQGLVIIDLRIPPSIYYKQPVNCCFKSKSAAAPTLSHFFLISLTTPIIKKNTCHVDCTDFFLLEFFFKQRTKFTTELQGRRNAYVVFYLSEIIYNNTALLITSLTYGIYNEKERKSYGLPW